MPSTEPDSIAVVAGIIWNSDCDALLLSRRPQHLHKGGLWEFPGGKIEVGEAPEQALARELQEELAIGFGRCKLFRQVDFDYPEKSVSLRFFHVYEVSGTVTANEGQQWRWVPLQELSAYPFPEANQPIVEALAALQA